MSEPYDLHPVFITIPHPTGPEKFATLAIPVEHPFIQNVGGLYFVEVLGQSVGLNDRLAGARLQVVASIFADWYEKRSDAARFTSHAVNYLTYSKQWKELAARPPE